MTLMYHNIALGRQKIDFSEWQPAYDVSYENFLAQLDLIQRLSDGNDQAHLTFDDGYRTMHQLVVPLREHFRFEYTCFVTTAAVGRSGMLSRREIRELAEAGMRVGTHSHSHIFLENLTGRQLLTEVLMPKQMLEDITGQAVHALSLPGGRYDRRTVEYAASNGYGEIYSSIPGARRIRLKPSPSLDLVPRWVITGRSSLHELEMILRAKRWHLIKRRSLYTAGRAGKFFLGNSGYHRWWQKIQHLTTSTGSERVTS